MLVKGRPPKINDLRKNGTHIPQKIVPGTKDNGMYVYLLKIPLGIRKLSAGLSILINDQLTTDEELVFYLGIVSQADTSKTQISNTEEQLLPGKVKENYILLNTIHFLLKTK